MQRDGGNHAVVKGGAIGQVGERVMASHMLDALLMAFPLSEFIDHTDAGLRRSVRVLHRQPGGGHNPRAIAGGDDRVLAEKAVSPEASSFLSSI